MASSLLALLDDIATVLDDVSTLTGVAARKSAGVLGDDLALNAEQVTGVRAARELPVVLAVAKGSAVNKLILVPAAVAVSALAPWVITPLLMAGGLFLCFEGFEKVAHRWLTSPAEDDAHHRELAEALADPAVDMAELERRKIRGAVRTDVVLSAEIIAITLGTVAGAPLLVQFGVLSGIAAMMTVGVYGLVAAIVKLDDAGLFLSRRTGADTAARAQRALGAGILRAAPHFMRGLSVLGTAAMFLVGGGILAHGLPGAETLVHRLGESLATLPAGAVLAWLTPLLANAVLGLLAGGVAVTLVGAVRRLIGQRAGTATQPGSGR